MKEKHPARKTILKTLLRFVYSRSSPISILRVFQTADGVLAGAGALSHPAESYENDVRISCLFPQFNFTPYFPVYA